MPGVKEAFKALMDAVKAENEVPESTDSAQDLFNKLPKEKQDELMKQYASAQSSEPAPENKPEGGEGTEGAEGTPAPESKPASGGAPSQSQTPLSAQVINGMSESEINKHWDAVKAVLDAEAAPKKQNTGFAPV